MNKKLPEGDDSPPPPHRPSTLTEEAKDDAAGCFLLGRGAGRVRRPLPKGGAVRAGPEVVEDRLAGRVEVEAVGPQPGLRWVGVEGRAVDGT